MYISLLMNLINLVGNAILIFIFRMGVAGAAIATLIARTVAALLIFRFMFDEKREIHFQNRLTLRMDIPQVKKNSLHRDSKRAGKQPVSARENSAFKSCVHVRHVCDCRERRLRHDYKL